MALLAFVGCRGTERAEAVEAAVEAAQMEGRTAAREFVNAQWKDTMELQEASVGSPCEAEQICRKQGARGCGCF